MPVELKEIDLERKIANTDDSGILVQTKPRLYVKNPQTDVVNWLKTFADDYWKLRHPGEEAEQIEEADDKPADDKGDASADDKSAVKEGDSTGQTDGANTSQKEGSKEDEKSETKQVKTGKDHIQFVHRQISVENQTLVFIATNLVDPSDYLWYVFDQMASNEKKRKTKFPMRAMPVTGLCLSKPRDMELATIAALEKVIGDDLPHRFSIQFYGSMEGENMTQKEAAAIVRNCVWSVNPNCVQCLKYTDLAITIDIVKPFFCLGHLYDFIKLRRYKTLSMKMGYDRTGENTDSEDEISDDPTLDEEEDRQRKMRIKRKRNADKAFKNAAENGNADKSSKSGNADSVAAKENGNDEEDAMEEKATEENGVNGDGHE